MTPARLMFSLAVLLLLAWSLLAAHVSKLGAAKGESGLSPLSQQQPPPEAVKISRLRPSDFRELPAHISTELVRRGCTIPQVTVEGLEMKEPHNVISGEFARRGQKDWAVLCSTRGRSAVHIFWGRPTKCLSIIGAQADNAERYIGTADAKYILDHYEAYGGAKPPPLEHLGINDGFAEKASQVWYCYGGRWRLLQGAD